MCDGGGARGGGHSGPSEERGSGHGVTATAPLPTTMLAASAEGRTLVTPALACSLWSSFHLRDTTPPLSPAEEQERGAPGFWKVPLPLPSGTWPWGPRGERPFPPAGTCPGTLPAACTPSPPPTGRSPAGRPRPPVPWASLCGAPRGPSTPAPLVPGLMNMSSPCGTPRPPRGSRLGPRMSLPAPSALDSETGGPAPRPTWRCPRPPRLRLPAGRSALGNAAPIFVLIHLFVHLY